VPYFIRVIYKSLFSPLTTAFTPYHLLTSFLGFFLPPESWKILPPPGEVTIDASFPVIPLESVVAGTVWTPLPS